MTFTKVYWRMCIFTGSLYVVLCIKHGHLVTCQSVYKLVIKMWTCNTVNAQNMIIHCEHIVRLFLIVVMVYLASFVEVWCVSLFWTFFHQINNFPEGEWSSFCRDYAAYKQPQCMKSDTIYTILTIFTLLVLSGSVHLQSNCLWTS